MPGLTNSDTQSLMGPKRKMGGKMSELRSPVNEQVTGVAFLLEPDFDTRARVLRRQMTTVKITGGWPGNLQTSAGRRIA
jgi:hypothetical protein